MIPVVLLLRPHLGEHLLNALLVRLGTALTLLLFPSAIAPDEGDVCDALP